MDNEKWSEDRIWFDKSCKLHYSEKELWNNLELFSPVFYFHFVILEEFLIKNDHQNGILAQFEKVTEVINKNNELIKNHLNIRHFLMELLSFMIVICNVAIEEDEFIVTKGKEEFARRDEVMFSYMKSNVDMKNFHYISKHEERLLYTNKKMNFLQEFKWNLNEKYISHKYKKLDKLNADIAEEYKIVKYFVKYGKDFKDFVKNFHDNILNEAIDELNKLIREDAEKDAMYKLFTTNQENIGWLKREIAVDKEKQKERYVAMFEYIEKNVPKFRKDIMNNFSFVNKTEKTIRIREELQRSFLKTMEYLSTFFD
ncbi:uncharacterized protein LOC136083462 [Hydra vulgaris]|uniref:Uncharacterized protein LOC136083462 n=1 Tax=Hydra vulgaris TaxID=6087 RepID=A0ABM4CB82_HYDVU